MFDYFRNYSSNAHQVCCENSCLKVYMTIASLMTLIFIHGHKCASNLTIFYLQYLGQYLSYYIHTWHDGRLMDALYAHARFDDLDLAAMSPWVGKIKNNQRCMLSATMQAISIKLARTVGHFYVTLTFQTFIWLDQLLCVCFLVRHNDVGRLLNNMHHLSSEARNETKKIIWTVNYGFFSYSQS